MKWTEANWRDHAQGFPGFLAPFAQPMGRSERREGAALYVEGLLLPGERKSIEPMAERLGIDSQKLQQLLADSPWDDREVWQAIRQVRAISLATTSTTGSMTLWIQSIRGRCSKWSGGLPRKTPAANT